MFILRRLDILRTFAFRSGRSRTIRRDLECFDMVRVVRRLWSRVSCVDSSVGCCRECFSKGEMEWQALFHICRSNPRFCPWLPHILPNAKAFIHRRSNILRGCHRRCKAPRYLLCVGWQPVWGLVLVPIGAPCPSKQNARLVVCGLSFAKNSDFTH